MELSFSGLEIEMRNEQCSNDHDLDIDPLSFLSWLCINSTGKEICRNKGRKQKTNRTRISVGVVLEILGQGTIMLVASLRRLPTPCPSPPTPKTGSLRPEREEKEC